MSESWAWARVEPPTEGDGMHRLVIEFCNDWQEWSIESRGAGGVRFTLDVSQAMLDELPEMVANTKKGK